MTTAVKKAIIRGAFLVLFFAFPLFDATRAFAGGGGGDGEAHGSEQVVEGPTYFEMQPITISVLDDGRVAHHYTYWFVLEIDNEEHREMVKKYMPRMKSEFVRYLHTVGSQRARAALKDIGFVKKKLTKISNYVLGEPVVHNVLLKTKIERDFNS